MLPDYRQVKKMIPCQIAKIGYIVQKSTNSIHAIIPLPIRITKHMAPMRTLLNLRLLPRLVVVLALFSFPVLSGCSKSTNSGGGGSIGNGEGLLDGVSTDNAVAQTEKYAAVVAPIVLIDSIGLLSNKVFAVISPSANVGQVNSLLDSLGAKIICMDAGSVFLTISFPAASDRLALDSVIARFADSEPFLFAFPCFLPIPPVSAEIDPTPPQKIIPGEPAASNIEHLKTCFMPAAWNLQSLATTVNRQVSVLIPDAYAQLSAIAEIPSQEFVPIQGDGADVRVFGNTAAGNHGFYTSGILGASYDDIGVTGIHPGNANLLRIRSLNVGSDEWGIKLQHMADEIATGSIDIVSTSLGYNDPHFAEVSKWTRILLALKWRELVGTEQSQFLHVTSSGNDGRVTGEGSLSVFNSPFTMAAQMVSPWDWLGVGEYTEADSLGYVQIQQLYSATKPHIVQPLTNVLVVGSSGPNGQRSAFSNVGADVRMVGEAVFSPCITNDRTCNSGFGSPSGTSMATPQVAGLAAYLMNLQVGLTPLQARQKILNAYDNSIGIVNAYHAVLNLDGSSGGPVRTSLLDIAGSSATPGTNGQFDEHDIALFLEQFSAASPYSRYDLNGDGFTGGGGAAKFDLTAENPPIYTAQSATVCGESKQFDENALSDRDILEYYANSSLYQGSTTERDQLLGCSGGGFNGFVLVTRRGSWVVASAKDFGFPGTSEDDVVDQQRDSTLYAPPYYFGSFNSTVSASLNCQIEPGDIASSTGSQSTSLSVIGPDTLLGFSGTESATSMVQSQFCSMSAGGTSTFELRFIVVGGPVYFTLTASGQATNSGTGFTLTSNSGSVVHRFDLPNQENASSFEVDGQLVPGEYRFQTGTGSGSNNGSVDFEYQMTFAPASPH